MSTDFGLETGTLKSPFYPLTTELRELYEPELLCKVEMTSQSISRSIYLACLKNDILSMMLAPKDAPEIASSLDCQRESSTNTMYITIGKIAT